MKKEKVQHFGFICQLKNNIKIMKKILFIEDEQALQTTFKDVLGNKDYKVISAFDGEEGLKLTQEENPDLILLDLILPRKEGIEVLREIKENEEIKDIPVIVLTNLEDLKNVEKALNLGAKNYLVKANYTLEEVVDKVKKNIKN